MKKINIPINNFYNFIFLNLELIHFCSISSGLSLSVGVKSSDQSIFSDNTFEKPDSCVALFTYKAIFLFLISKTYRIIFSRHIAGYCTIKFVHTAFKKGHWSVEKGTFGAQKRT